MAPDAISATAEGFNEMIDRVPTLTRVHVHYALTVPAEAPREKVERALETHVAKCPTAQSIKDAVEITWTAAVEET